MSKKFMSLFISLVMIISLGGAVNAESLDINYNVSEPADMIIYDEERDYELREYLLSSDEVPECDKKILRGEDFKYGSSGGAGAMTASLENIGDTAEPMWKAGGATHTHQYITKIAMYIIGNDLGYNPLNSHSNAIAVASDKPDEDENDWVNIWHFYNPDTGKNYGGGSDTALTKLVSHYNAAVSEYNAGNTSAAMDRLGRACHYIADLSEPHHASDKTAANSNHMDFEKYADDNRASFYNLTMGEDSYNYARNNSVSTIGHNFAVYAKSKINLALNTATYETAASDTMRKAQRNTACLLYKFMLDADLVE